MIWANEWASELTAYEAGAAVGTAPSTFHLTTTNRTPLNTDVFASNPWTELSYSGYSATALTSGSWTVTGGYPTGGSEGYTYPTITYTFPAGAGATVYGYYITIAPSATYLWGAEQFASPYVIPTGGGALVLPITLVLGQR
jgi:hypothetical protein